MPYKPIAPWLREAVESIDCAGSGRIESFVAPLGGTDASPFIQHGWDAVGLCCLDPELGAPRHYHLPSDTLENLDMDQLMRSIDVVEALARELVRRRLG